MQAARTLSDACGASLRELLFGLRTIFALRSSI